MTRIDLVGVCAHCVPAAPSPDRAALVDALATEIVDAESAINDGNPVLLARRLVAWFEAAGWGPPVEPITEDEIAEIATGIGIDVLAYRSASEIMDNVLAALPERHRRLVLGE